MLRWNLRPLGNVLQCPGIWLKSVQPSDFGGKLKESGEGRDYTRTLLHLNLREIVQHILMNAAKKTFYADFISENSTDQGKLFRAAKKLLSKKEKLCVSLITLTKLSSSTTLLISLWVRSIQSALTLMLWAHCAWKTQCISCCILFRWYYIYTCINNFISTVEEEKPAKEETSILKPLSPLDVLLVTVVYCSFQPKTILFLLSSN